jgi:hypothetical protein
MIQPKAKMQQQDIAPREYVFVVDNSGSMSGFPMQQARAVVRRCLNNLTTRETFQIIKFAGYPDQLAPKAIKATPANIQQGINYVSRMRGGGGTEFIPALKLALLAPKSKNRSRIVLFITDGYIGYERQVLRFLRDNIKDFNLFSLGVGSSVNRFLIDGMARIGVGSPFYLLNTEKASSVVERIFSTISKPALTNISIDWGSLDAEEMTPSAVPDLFGKKPVFVAGRYDKGGSGTVTVRGRLAGRAFVRKVKVTLPSKPTGNNTAVAYLWARRQIADQMDIFGTEPQRQKEVEKSVTKLALSYNLMSKFTSFVAVDSKIRNQGGQQTTVDVPVPLPQGVSPLAAPKGAYVGGSGYGYGARTRGYGGGGRRYKSVRVRRPRHFMPAPAADALGGLALSAGDSSTEAAPSKPRPRPRTTATVAKQDAKGKGERLKVRMGGLRVIAGSASKSSVEPKLNKLVKDLASKIRSLSGGRSGWLKLRLTLDTAGRVKKLSFVSGTLMLPSLKKELKRALGKWRLGSLSGETTVVFTLRFS